MTFLHATELKELMETTGKPHVSIYLPAPSAKPKASPTPVRLRHLLNEVQAQLVAGRWFPVDAVELLKSLETLIEKHNFNPRQGLAIFCSSERCRTYSLPIRSRPFAIVTHRFHLKPLLPLLTETQKFLILAVHQHRPRLFQANQHAMAPIPLADVPQYLAQAVSHKHFEEQLHDSNLPNLAAIDREQGTDRAGHGVIRRFQHINKQVMSLRQDPQMPLLLMGTTALCSIYRCANPHIPVSYTYRTDHADLLSSELLHQRAWQIVAPHFEQVKQKAVSQCRRLSSTQQTSNDLQDIVRAAYNGQVETLLVATGRQLWGHFNPQTDEVEVRRSRVKDSEDLLDLAAVQTWLRGGQVHVLEQPVDNVPLTAILRCPQA